MITVVNAAFYGNERQMGHVVDQPNYEGVEYVLYTNDATRAEGTIWKTIELIPENGGKRLAARKIKTAIHEYHPNSEYWLWIDASMELKVSPTILVEKYLNKFDMCAMPHPERNNWVEEAEAILNYKMDTRDNLQRAVSKYITEGCAPTQLWETGCFLRRNTNQIKEFNNIWWNEIQTNSIRDQISVQYASWKSGAHINSFPGTNSTNKLRYDKKPYLPQWNEIIRAW